MNPDAALSDEVEDEVKEGVWGYLFPLDTRYGRCVVMKKRSTCPKPDTVAGVKTVRKTTNALQQEDNFENTKVKGVPSGGYLIGRHPECGTCSISLFACALNCCD